MHDKNIPQEFRQRFETLTLEYQQLAGKFYAFQAEIDAFHSLMKEFGQSLPVTSAEEVPASQKIADVSLQIVDTSHPEAIQESDSGIIVSPQIGIPSEEYTTPLYLRNLHEEEAAQSSFELDMGIKWLSRIGIVALLIGIAMALCYTFPSFSNPMKIFSGFVIAGILYGSGHFLYQKANTLGRILQGGGLSVGYLSLFAIFFIPGVQLLDNAGLGLFSLFCYVGMALFLAHRLSSQTVALLSLAFGYYTSGYAVSAEIAFLASSILSLTTVGLAKLHPEWRIISKANLVGAFITYAVWNCRVNQYDQVTGKTYLIFTFLLFHIVSLLRAQSGDMLLSQLNTFGFYLLYLTTQPTLGSFGVFEGMIASVQLSSLAILKLQGREEKSELLAQGLLMTGLLFVGIATVRYFDGKLVSAIFAAEAFSMAFLSVRSQYRRMLEVTAYIFLFLAYFLMFPVWGQLDKTSLTVSSSWIGLVTVLIETIPFKAHSKAVRTSLLVCVHLLALCTIMMISTPEWRTMSIMAVGFLELGIGFAFQRKVYRVLSLAWIFVIGGISMLLDMASLSTGYKILLFILLGIGLLVGSFFYSLLAKRLLAEEGPSENITDSSLVK